MALSMMVEKESGLLRDVEFPTVWTEEKDHDATNSSSGSRYVMPFLIGRFAHSLWRFLNTITGTRLRRKPKLCLGGLLADVGY